MPSTEIILTENVPGLGAEADVVKVRRGYARNYLLPHGKAHEVTPASLRQLDALKAKRAEREAREYRVVEDSPRSEEHTSELQSHSDLVCRLLLEKKNPHGAGKLVPPMSA